MRGTLSSGLKTGRIRMSDDDTILALNRKVERLRHETDVLNNQITQLEAENARLKETITRLSEELHGPLYERPSTDG